jgi:integrase
MSSYRRERPYKRTLDSGREVWVARYTGADGKRRYAKPAWNGGSGQFKRKTDAQRAIDEAYAQPTRLDTVGAYARSWTARHPRSERTNATNEHRIGRVLDVWIEGVRLRDWPLAELRRKHATDLVDHMLREQKRARLGVVGILSALSAMFEDAIDDELAGANPFRGVRVRSADPRISKAAKAPRIFTFEEMRTFATGGQPAMRAKAKAAAKARDEIWPASPKRDYEAMLLVFATTGLRLGEVLGLERRDFDGETITVRGTAHKGRFIEGDSDEKRHVRTVPIAPSLKAALEQLPARIDTRLMFPTPTGRIWIERNFYRDVWQFAREATGIDARPHDFRHSYVSHLRAAGIDDADLADVTGHRVETMLSHYTHALGKSHDAIREAIG